MKLFNWYYLNWDGRVPGYFFYTFKESALFLVPRLKDYECFKWTSKIDDQTRAWYLNRAGLSQILCQQFGSLHISDNQDNFELLKIPPYKL